jgi:NADH-quinone oxidoreductase subunit N
MIILIIIYYKLYLGINEEIYLFNNNLVLNKYNCFFKILILIADLFVLIALYNSTNKRYRPEDLHIKFYTLNHILFFMYVSTYGMILMLMSNSLIIMFLCIELISFCLYILCSSKYTNKSTEAGLKYYIYGSYYSLVML